MKTSQPTKKKHKRQGMREEGHNRQTPHKKIFKKYMQEKLAITFFVIMLALFALILVLYQIVKEINENYYIEAFIDNKKPGYYAGKKVFKANKLIKQYQYDKILVMIYDRNECAKISKQLVCELGVNAEKIEMGYIQYTV